MDEERQVDWAFFSKLPKLTDFDIDDTERSSLDLSGLIGQRMPLELEPKTYSLEEILAELD